MYPKMKLWLASQNRNLQVQGEILTFTYAFTVIL